MIATKSNFEGPGPSGSRHHIHLDAVGGIAGDMFVAALLDAFPQLRDRVFADLAAVLPHEAGLPFLRAGDSAGVAAWRFGLESVGRHSDDHHHDTTCHRDGHHHDTSYQALVARITTTSLSAGTAECAAAILKIIARAESCIHGCPIEQVHFHELADWDSLMDVVAAGSIVAALADVSWSVSDLPRGHGLVRTAHGMLPVPAPATAEILKGFSWRDDGIGGERVTPTGAAILAHLVGRDRPSGRLIATGTGAGTRTLPGMPNILRALVLERRAGPAPDLAIVSFDVDDMTGEEIGIALDRFRAAEGVIDVTIGTRQGKKGRPVTDFRLLVNPVALEQVTALCLEETSTIGLRWHLEQRVCLDRLQDDDVKRVRRPDGAVTAKAESDSLSAISTLAARRRLKQTKEQE